jgi:glycosyltransferase involved in cell wall biosynthesis
MSHEVSRARPSVTVVIPARNEARNIGYVLDRLPGNVQEVVLVDGSSADNTIEVARSCYPSIIVVHQTRRGKGNALAAGFAAATGDYVVMIDADGSMDPAEIPSFIAALEQGADYAKGSRFVAGGGSDDISWTRHMGNLFLNGITNLLFSTKYSDLCYGYNAFRRECISAFALPPAHDTSVPSYWGDGFEIETLINIRVAKAKLDIREVASFEALRISGESNLRTFRDGTRVLVTIIRERCTLRSKSVASPNADLTQPVVVDLPDRSQQVLRSEALAGNATRNQEQVG